MITSRWGPRATLVGDILFVTGGFSKPTSKSILSWDPVAKTWQPAGDLAVGRFLHAAVPVPGSTVAMFCKTWTWVQNTPLILLFLWRWTHSCRFSRYKFNLCFLKYQSWFMKAPLLQKTKLIQLSHFLQKRPEASGCLKRRNLKYELDSKMKESKRFCTFNFE